MNPTVKEFLRHGALGLIAGGLFLLFFIALDLNIFVSIGLGIAAYIAGLFTFQSPAAEAVADRGGISGETLNKVVSEVSEKLKTLESNKNRIKKAQVRSKLDEICSSVRKILDNFKKDPKDIKAAKNFLNYYLDATITLVEKYVDLSSKEARSQNIEETLAKAENLLDVIKESFKKQYIKLLDDDVMNLDVEIEVLEKTLKMEGM